MAVAKGIGDHHQPDKVEKSREDDSDSEHGHLQRVGGAGSGIQWVG